MVIHTHRVEELSRHTVDVTSVDDNFVYPLIVTPYAL